MATAAKAIERTQAPAGLRVLEVIRNGETTPRQAVSLLAMLVHALPIGVSREVARYRVRNLPNIWRGFWRVAIARLFKLRTMYGAVHAVVKKANGQIIDYGLISLRVVTDNGVAFIVDAFQNQKELENMKYHGFGTGTTAEAAADSALVTELTTQYATDNTRPTGSLTEGTENVFRTVGTLSPDASVAITEHGIFDQASNAGGVLMDRSKFSAINLVSGDSLQVTYDMTYTSGS